MSPGAIIGGRYVSCTIPPPAIGGFAEVYCAEELGDELNSKVAVKILKADRSCDPQLVDRFKQEVIFLAASMHEMSSGFVPGCHMMMGVTA